MLIPFKAWLDTHLSHWSKKRFLVAVSGGVDSVVLADLFRQCGVHIEVVHCNFNLRGDESMEDENFVRQLALQWNVPVHIKLFETEQFASENKMGTQEAAREIRYNWFEEVRRQHKLDYVAVGTHKDDEAETLLINMIRGTGIYGLHGILPVNGFVVRPLLDFNRSEIVSYAQQNTLNWQEDSSNQSTKYLRNKIRLDIIPILREINPNIENKLADNARHLRDYEELITNEIQRIKPQLLLAREGYWQIDKSYLSSLSPSYLYLYECIREFGFTHTQCKQMCESLNHKPGGVFASHEFELLNDRKFLILTPIQHQQVNFLIQENDQDLDAISGRTSQYPAANFKPLADPNRACFDLHKLHFPLTVRPWREGDRFKPLGMKGMKKISDFLIDSKVPRTLKKDILVLESKGKIAWVIGMRLDDRFKVDNRTEQVYQIELAD